VTDQAKAGETTFVHIRQRLAGIAGMLDGFADDATDEATRVAGSLIPPEAADDSGIQ
jgi:hypothetical protein